jgi:TetR/AcrR family transcriptional regulator, tetracycline repressor protein
VVAATGTRSPLTRSRILQAALAYVDKHGLDALSMHKLGAELGVKGMSLYNHVDGKDGLLDGLVEAMWNEVEPPDDEPLTWQDDVRAFAQSLRELVHRHPEAAQLLMNRRIMPLPALEYFDVYVRRLEAGGLSAARALEVVRTLIAYAIGFAYFELTWTDGEEADGAEPDDGLRAFQHVHTIVSPGTPEHLLRLAMALCTRCDMDAQFKDAIALIVRSLEAE